MISSTLTYNLLNIDVIKRDESKVKFDSNKISVAIYKASMNHFDHDRSLLIAQELLPKVLSRLTDLIFENLYIKIEDIQDVIEEILMNSEYKNIAKSYILYRGQHTQLRDEKYLFDVDRITGSYVDKSDWRVNENSNVNYSLGGLILHNSASVTASYWLNRVYTEEIRNAHINGDIHIHDLGMLSPYCFTGDTRVKLLNGTNPSFKELCKDYANKEFYVYSRDNNQDLVIGKAHSPRLIKNSAPLVEIILNTESKIRCTPDHKFMMHDGTYLEAVNLYKDANLCALYLEFNYKVTSIKFLDYTEDVYCLTVDEYENFALDSGVFVHNCAGWNLRDLISRGIKGVAGKTACSPAKHFDTIVNQMVNFLGILQNEWAGAQAFSSFDTYLAPFIYYDKLEFNAVKHKIQSFIFGVNTPSRWGCQSPFTNITLDLKCPEDLKDQPITINGSVTSDGKTYKDFQEEMNLINNSIYEVLLEGDANGRTFPYPIPTINLTKDFDWDSKLYDDLWKLTGKYGTPYFQNFINSDLNPRDVHSMCCRLRLDKKELRRRGGGLFGCDELTGSLGVVTINMSSLGYQSSSKSEFFYKLKNILRISKDSLEFKKKVIERLLKEGMYPFTNQYLSTLKNHFLTIGLLGVHECCINFLKEGIQTKVGKEFAIEILQFMRSEISKFQEETGNLYNLEATPCEGTSYRLAKIDKKRFNNLIFTSGDEYPYYTNSTMLPVNYSTDIFEVLDHQEDLQVLYTGGTVIHLFLGESITDYLVVKNLVKRVASSYKIPYFTITPSFSICNNHGYIVGEEPTCPSCGQETEVYTRIVGYYRPVKQWNLGKKSEYVDRTKFSLPL